jgi:hypothetical protein
LARVVGYPVPAERLANLRFEFLENFLDHRAVQSLFARLGVAATALQNRPLARNAHIGCQDSLCREHGRRYRNHNGADSGFPTEYASVHRTRAAIGEQTEIARVVTALQCALAQQVGHLLVGHLAYPRRSIEHRKSERFGDMLSDGVAGRLALKPHLAAQVFRVQEASVRSAVTVGLARRVVTGWQETSPRSRGRP